MFNVEPLLRMTDNNAVAAKRFESRGRGVYLSLSYAYQ